MLTKTLLRDWASSEDIDLLRVTDAAPFDQVAAYLEERAKRGLTSPFEPKDRRRRCYPEELMSGTASIISVGLAYHDPHAVTVPHDGGGPRGRISCHAWGTDYHDALQNRIEGLLRRLSNRCPEANYQAFVDTGPPVDRAVAARSGLGWFGRNTSIITPEYGSWIFLGTILTNLEFEPDEPLDLDCGDCDLCLRSCPTDALYAPDRLDPNRCLSYVTQMKGTVPMEFRETMGNRLYGCDICQRVCPKNQDVLKVDRPEFTPDPEDAFPRLVPLLDLSKDEFEQRFGSSALAWRGRTTLQRNAIIALGNWGHAEALAPLERCLSDERCVIRLHSAWAIGKIGGRQAEHVLTDRLEHEPDSEVRSEIETALKEGDF